MKLIIKQLNLIKQKKETFRLDLLKKFIKDKVIYFFK